MQLSQQQVRERAYYIWEEQGRVHGRADDHWLQAEGELLQAVVAEEPVLVVAKKVAKPRTKTATKVAPAAAKPVAKARKKSAPGLTATLSPLH